MHCMFPSNCGWNWLNFKLKFLLTGVTQERATKNDTIITIPVNISRLICNFLNKLWNSSINPVITHSKPPIWKTMEKEKVWNTFDWLNYNEVVLDFFNFGKLTALSIPSMITVRKNKNDHIWLPGNVPIASGYTSNTNPGPLSKQAI